MNLHAPRPTLGAGLVLAASLLAFAPSAAASAPQGAKASASCSAALRTGQESARAGRLGEARASFAACAKRACGSVQSQCVSQIVKLEAEMPTIVPLVTSDGKPRSDAVVLMDGKVLQVGLDGRPVSVDPGTHQFTFSVDGEVFGEQSVRISRGQKRRTIEAILYRRMDGESAPGLSAAAGSAGAPAEPVSTSAEEAPPPKSEPPPVPASAPARKGGGPWPFVLGGVGVAAIGTGALLTYWGRKDNDALAQCSPNCSSSSVTHIKTLYVGADVALGAGALALGVATLLYVAAPSREKPPEVRTGLALDVVPSQSGAYAAVSGAF